MGYFSSGIFGVTNLGLLKPLDQLQTLKPPRWGPVVPEQLEQFKSVEPRIV